MKLKNVLPTSALLLVVLVSGCNKDLGNGSSDLSSSSALASNQKSVQLPSTSGNVLSQTAVNMQTGATINGRTLAQTAVTLQMNTVTKP